MGSFFDTLLEFSHLFGYPYWVTIRMKWLLDGDERCRDTPWNTHTYPRSSARMDGSSTGHLRRGLIHAEDTRGARTKEELPESVI